MGRIILYTGKGGVGKTTLSAATAAYLASLGKRTLIVSVDPAHSLSDVFELELSPEPKEIAPNLFAQEIDVYYSVERFWGKLQEYLKSLLRWQGVENVLSEELAILPGMEEVCSFLWINQHYKEGRYEVIIVDSAPTGETMRLLSLPDAASWWISKVLPLQRKLMKFVRPAAKMVTDMPLPEEETYDALEELFQQVYHLYYTLQDPLISSVRIVTNPEKMVLRETEKAYTYLHLFGFNIDAILLNKTPTERSKSEKFRIKYVEHIKDAFYPTPVIEIPQFDQEILGLEKLRQLGKAIYKEKDPSEIFFQDKTFHIIEENGYFVLKFYLKEIPEIEPEIYRKDEDLFIKIKNFKKYFYLPRILAKKEIKKAIITSNQLQIYFS